MILIWIKELTRDGRNFIFTCGFVIIKLTNSKELNSVRYFAIFYLQIYDNICYYDGQIGQLKYYDVIKNKFFY